MHHTTGKIYGGTFGFLSTSLHSGEMKWSSWYCPLSALWKIFQTVACLSRSPAASPSVDHQTSTILTSVEELSCQAFILLRDQGPSCSYLNITLVFCGFGVVGAGGIPFMWVLNTQNALAWPLSFGGIIWWIHVLQQLLAKSQQGSKSDKKALHQVCHMVTFIFVKL